MSNTTSKEELKIQALLERVSELTATYENKVADLRVDLTLISEDYKRLSKELERAQVELNEVASQLHDDNKTLGLNDVVEGEVVQKED